MSWDNARNMREAMAAAKPQKLKAYEWCRVRNDFVDMPIWRAVALKTGVHLTYVVAMVMRLEALANRSRPRGSVADMSISEFAASLDLRPTVVARIRSALEEPDIAWIDQDVIVDFHQRNPDHEDSTAAERQRRRRAKLKEEREAAMMRSPPSGYPPSRDVTRDTVTVTTRSDQIFTTGSSVNSGTDPPRQLGSTSDDIVDFGRAQLWLRTDGERFVCERMRVLRARAGQLIERWDADISDLLVLVRFLRGAIAANVVGDQFQVLIEDQINRHRRGEEQHALPLAPVAIGRRSHG